MGWERNAKVHLGNTSAICKVMLESQEIIIRGTLKGKYPLSKLTKLQAKAGQLSFEHNKESIDLELGEDAAAWLERIKNPRTRAEKLGLKEGMKVTLLGPVEKDVPAEVAQVIGNKPQKTLGKNIEMVLLFLESPAELDQLSVIRQSLMPGGCVWNLFPKGRKDLSHEVIVAAGREAGLTLSKSMAFSERLTGIRLSRPRS